MKKFISLLLVTILCLGLISGCSGSSNNETKSQLVVLDESLSPEEYAIAFKKGNTELHNAIMYAFDEVIANGKAAEISTKWFGKDIVMKSDTKAEKAAYPEGKTTFVMGLDDSFPPMGFRDENNEIVGFDIDMAKAVCEILNIELVLQPINWATKELELESGKIDCIWNGLTRTDEREETFLLSRSYLKNNQVVVVNSTSGINEKSGLSGKKVGVQTGSSAEEALSKDSISSELSQVVQYDDNVTALQDLKVGRIDAVVLDEVVARYYISVENNK